LNFLSYRVVNFPEDVMSAPSMNPFKQRIDEYCANYGEPSERPTDLVGLKSVAEGKSSSSSFIR